ncbi:galactose oxidase, partial [Testicularia cyperi]
QPSTSNAGGSTAVIGSCGVNAQHLFLGTEDGVYIVDRSQNNPMRTPDGANAATAAIWSLSDGSCRAQDAATNQFCAGGAATGGGQWIQAGGNPEQNNQGEGNGLRALRQIDPCSDQSCGWREQNLLQRDRWYPTVETMGDGSAIIFGGYNAQVFLPIPQSGNTPTAEFFPSRGAPVNVPILDRSWPFSLYPLTALLSDGRFFMVSGNQTAIWNPNDASEVRLPDMPNGPRTYPSGGAHVLLPLTPANNYAETLMYCGGTNIPDWGNAYCPGAGAHEVPANNKCDFINPLSNGASWRSGADMPHGRVMGNFIILPDGKIAIVNGAKNGVQGFGCGFPGESQASNPALEVDVYDPATSSWSTIATAQVNRGYHASATLLPDGSILTAGSSPHHDVNTELQPFPTEYRLEKIFPSYYNQPRPNNTALPTQYNYGGQSFTITFDNESQANSATVRLIKTGWSTHSLQMGQRAIELAKQVQGNQATFSNLPNNPNLMPPGAALAFLVVNGIPSIGRYAIVG